MTTVCHTFFIGLTLFIFPLQISTVIITHSERLSRREKEEREKEVKNGKEGHLQKIMSLVCSAKIEYHRKVI